MFLNNHTYYSLRYGTISPKRLLELAKKYDLEQLVITDINNTSTCLDIVRLSTSYKIKPILGVDFRNGVQQQFIMLAKNNNGFEKINSYLSDFLKNKKLKIPQKAKKIPHTIVIYPFKNEFSFPLNTNEYIGIRKEELSQFKFSKWSNRLNKVVVLQTVTFEDKKGFNTHRLLRAIDNNTLLSKLSLLEQASEEDKILSPDNLKNAFIKYPQIIENTKNILDQCSIKFDFSGKTSKNQKIFGKSKEHDYELLKKMSYAGISYRYQEPSEEIYNRIEKELNIIKEKGFVSYFLINWKILEYARAKGYFYVGRGSGANSIIAYLLRITNVDPLELDLYFERFINLYRKTPPDFDIDFSWKDRDDIIQFIFSNFKNTALLAIYNTFKYKAAVRELGKVFGLPKSEIDRLSSSNYNYDELDKLSKLVITYASYIEGFPNYLGIHAGGILISDKPIHYYTATFIPPKGYSTTQFDMVISEDVGLHKFDILSQRGLSKIKESIEMISHNNTDLKPFNLSNINYLKKDLKIKLLLKEAKVIGCFYVESPAMRMLLKKLQVTDYLGLVAASSIIRPGVAKSGMMREYILRFRYPERRKEVHPTLLSIMPETYGIMVYQEDVIKVAHHFGGLSLGEADMLRRGMSGKFRSRKEFLKVKDRFFLNCKNKGVSLQLTKEIWEQIESFAGYAFAKGHSASYAIESYQSLFLKAYYPLEYMVATINNSGGFYNTELYIHEARMHGGIIKPPCINKSYSQTVIYGKEIYIGFMFLHSLESNAIQKIIEERSENGLFKSLKDFMVRVSISMEQIIILIKINAFNFTKKSKQALLWEAHISSNHKPLKKESFCLFNIQETPYKIPELPNSYLEDAFDQIELLGFPLCSPFKLLATKSYFLLKATNLHKYKNKFVTIEGYLITTKRTRTSNDKYMFFGTFLDREGCFIDSVHFPQVIRQYPFRGKGIYRLYGKVLEEFDCITIEVKSMHYLPIIKDPRYIDHNKKGTPFNKNTFKKL